jgi:hypothetical protein
MNPGINPYPNGLFWTIQVPDDSVRVNPGGRRAIYRATNLEITDYGDFNTALSGAAGTPATVSFEVQWMAVDERRNIKNTAARFGGEFVRGQAQMAWSAVVGHYAYESGPLATSTSDFASLGTERNGVFFPRA